MHSSLKSLKVFCFIIVSLSSLGLRARDAPEYVIAPLVLY